MIHPGGHPFEHLHRRDQEGRIAGHIFDWLSQDHVVDDDLAHPRGQYDGQVLGHPMAQEADGIPKPHVPEEQHAAANDPEGLAVVDVGLAVGETRAIVEGLLVLAQGAQGDSGPFEFPLSHRPGLPFGGPPGSPRIERTRGSGRPQCPSGPRGCRFPRCGRGRDRGCCPRGGWSKSGG